MISLRTVPAFLFFLLTSVISLRPAQASAAETYRSPFPPVLQATASDTTYLTLAEFIRTGLAVSGQTRMDRAGVDLALNRVDQARAQRILPRFNLQTQHGLIPGVTSDSLLPSGSPLPEGQFYLDPYLTNDWTDWSVFTRAQIEAVQPLYTWGGIPNAIQAAESAARAAQYEFETRNRATERTLHELWNGYLLATEIERILADATDQVDRVQRQLDRIREEGEGDLSESDLFKFDIYLAEFEAQRRRAQAAGRQVQRIWDYVTRELPGVALPADPYLEPAPMALEPFETYLEAALLRRPELKGADAAEQAVSSALRAMQAEAYPNLFLALSASVAVTPNRPKQDNPFIINNTNYASARFGIGIRQNLNFLALDASLEKGRIDYRRTQDLRAALEDAIFLGLNEAYLSAEAAAAELESAQQALSTSKNWVRHEQLNYDYGFGDVKELVESMRTELELRVDVARAVHDWNLRRSELLLESGMTVTELAENL